MPLPNTILGVLTCLLIVKNELFERDDLLAFTERNEMLHNHSLVKKLREYLVQNQALILDD